MLCEWCFFFSQHFFLPLTSSRTWFCTLPSYALHFAKFFYAYGFLEQGVDGRMVLNFVANTLEGSISLIIILSWSGFWWLFSKDF